MSHWETYLAENQDRFVAELIDFVRIPSISSLPEHTADVQRAGEWVAARLQTAGLENIEIMPTAGHPVVYADWLHAPGQPTVLIYGHFDVQPVDPLHLWERDPFDPVVENGRITARGASDDKGNMFVPIVALEALLRSRGSLPVNIKCLFEGQEEIGSPHLPPFIVANKDKFSCDYIVSSDGSQWSESQPCIWLSTKGLSALQIDVKGARGDLHSGVYGGAVANPLHALTHILASMRSADGKILVEGFFDDVVPLSADDRAKIAEIPYDEAQFMADLQVPALYGEPGYTTYERSWARPTLEINGVWGGFQGDGVKTVLPNEAHAKITCRLVADQGPDNIADLIRAHVERVAPPGVTVTVTQLASKADPYLMASDHPANQAAHEVLEELYGRSPFYVRTGGSVPIYRLLLDNLGVYPLTFAFGLEDENLHAPNEFYRLSSFRRGQQGYCMLLERLGHV